MAPESGFIDIHSHVLFGVDDGARDIEEALGILSEAERTGVAELVLTPHFPFRMESAKISESYSALMEAARHRGIGVKLHLGAELYLEPELPGFIKENMSLTIDGKGRHALVELPPFEVPSYAEGVFFELMIMGITPVWAHPERCLEVYNDHRVLKKFVDKGILLQINAGSLIGNYGRRAKSAALNLISGGYGDILASDTHSPGNIGTSLPNAFTVLEKKAGGARAVDMAFTVPYKLVS